MRKRARIKFRRLPRNIRLNTRFGNESGRQNLYNEANIIDKMMGYEGESNVVMAESFKAMLPIYRINHKNFFIDDWKGGYMTKKGFLSVVYSSSTNELKAFEMLFKVMTRNWIIESPPYSKLDRRNRPYRWCRFSNRPSDSGFKVICEERLGQLLDLYQLKIAVCDLTLDRLYHEAISILPPSATL